MPKISISDYDIAERAGSQTLSARQIQSFSPVTFLAAGYPVKVWAERELLRYVDTMHDTKDARYFQGGSLYSDYERNAILQTAETVTQLTNNLGASIRPWMSLFASVPMFRLIHHISRNIGKKLSVFEIGPGSGYLGALLVQDGHRYVSMENTQAFYLWQNRLYDHLCGEDYVDLATSHVLDANAHAKVLHIPWWKFAAITDNAPANVDIVVCDHALGEMTRIALKFVLRTTRLMLAGDALKLFLFISHGRPQENSLAAIRNEFFECGYSLISYGLYHAFIPPNNPFSTLGGNRLALFSSSPLGILARRKQRRRALGKIPPTLLRPNSIDLIGDGATEASSFFPLAAAEAPMDYAFLARCGLKVPLFSQY